MKITYSRNQFRAHANKDEEVFIRMDSSGGATAFACLESFLYCAQNEKTTAGILTNERFEYIWEVFNKFIPQQNYKLDKLNKRIDLSNGSSIYIYNELNNKGSLSGLRCQFLVLDRFTVPDGDYIDFIKLLCKTSERGQRKFIRIHNNFPNPILSDKKQKEWDEFREIMISILFRMPIAIN